MISYIGIDPGKNGGIAITDGRTISAWAMPASPADLAALLRDLDGVASARVAVVEKVASSPQMGVKSAFTFGQGYGTLLGVLAALQIRVETVTPQKWQKAVGCLTGGDKGVTRSAALRLWPRGPDPWLHEACSVIPDCATRITHATADAMLIAEWARRAGL